METGFNLYPYRINKLNSKLLFLEITSFFILDI